MVSAKGRVAVYDVSLKLAAAFTLRLSFAPVANIKAPLSNPAAPRTATGTSASKRATTAATNSSSYNATSSQKVFTSFSCYSTSSELNYNAHSIVSFLPLLSDNFFFQSQPFPPFFPFNFHMRKECHAFFSMCVKLESFAWQIFQSFHLIANRLFLQAITQKRVKKRPANTCFPIETLTLGGSRLMILIIS